MGILSFGNSWIWDYSMELFLLALGVVWYCAIHWQRIRERLEPYVIPYRLHIAVPVFSYILAVGVLYSTIITSENNTAILEACQIMRAKIETLKNIHEDFHDVKRADDFVKIKIMEKIFGDGSYVADRGFKIDELNATIDEATVKKIITAYEEMNRRRDVAEASAQNSRPVGSITIDLDFDLPPAVFQAWLKRFEDVKFQLGIEKDKMFNSLGLDEMANARCSYIKELKEKSTQRVEDFKKKAEQVQEKEMLKRHEITEDDKKAKRTNYCLFMVDRVVSKVCTGMSYKGINKKSENNGAAKAGVECHTQEADANPSAPASKDGSASRDGANGKPKKNSSEESRCVFRNFLEFDLYGRFGELENAITDLEMSIKFRSFDFPQFFGGLLIAMVGLIGTLLTAKTESSTG